MFDIKKVREKNIIKNHKNKVKEVLKYVMEDYKKGRDYTIINGIYENEVISKLDCKNIGYRIKRQDSAEKNLFNLIIIFK